MVYTIVGPNDQYLAKAKTLSQAKKRAKIEAKYYGTVYIKAVYGDWEWKQVATVTDKQKNPGSRSLLTLKIPASLAGKIKIRSGKGLRVSRKRLTNPTEWLQDRDSALKDQFVVDGEVFGSVRGPVGSGKGYYEWQFKNWVPTKGYVSGQSRTRTAARNKLKAAYRLWAKGRK